MRIVGMEKKEPKDRERINAVLKILMKQAPLTMKQEKFCNDGCVERFLKARGHNVKKAAKHLRGVLSWRDSIGTEHLIADEFSAELADGVAHVAGHDDEARPVMVFRIKQDYPKIYSQKSFVRLLVFTLEVAVSSMSRFVDQFVLLFDASFFRSGSTFLNLFIGTLKIIADYYPGRLYRAFVIDPPPVFSLLWKGVRPFVELASVTAVVSSVDYLEDSTSTLGTAAGGVESCSFIGSHPRTASLRLESSALTTKPSVGSTSNRFSFTVSRFDSLKPWYLSTSTSTSTSATSNRIASPSLVGASPLSARSFSFASPAARSGSTPRTPCPSSSMSSRKQQQQQQTARQQPRTPLPSFLQSPAMLFNAKSRAGVRDREREGERERDAFLPFLRFYRKPYDEKLYRAKMRPPLGGLISIVSNSHTLKRPQQQQQQQQRQHGGTALLHHYQRF
ncbi:uncharacterized protein LOC109720906 [Ananas comosus]|uniref:Uncharacterized protein LOC109720906 n=1 Tax=Ananas comosus TaxID=4615 RepID=A0A6P5GEN5_ANACO|nr:uncharacterized protein LOC109720906 [Ananas comosus]